MSSIELQDEILQMMYWMRGENLGSGATVEQIDRFVQASRPELERALDALIARRFIAPAIGANGAFYELTAQGLTEGQRRFEDEFRGALGRESHFECGDVDCDCHAPGFQGVCLNASQQHP